MRRGRMFLILALILIIAVAVVAVFGSRFLGPTTPKQPATEVPTPTPVPVKVVVITQKVARGTALTEDVLGTVDFQRDYLMPGMLTDIKEAVGRRVKFDLDAGIILTSAMLAASPEDFAKTGSDWAILIPRGMVAVSIPISRLSSVSYAPQKGDHVNVIVTMMMVDLDTAFQSILPNSSAQVIAPGPLGENQPDTLTAHIVPGGGPFGRTETDVTLNQPIYTIPSESQRPRLVSQTLIQNVVVLQVGNFPLPEEAKTGQKTLPGQEVVPEATPTPLPGETQPVTTPVPAPAPPPPPDVITLIVSPQDAVSLNYLLYSGSELTLALRSADDETTVQTEAVTLQYLLDSYSVPVPVKLPYGLEPRKDRLAQPTLTNENLPEPTPVP